MKIPQGMTEPQLLKIIEDVSIRMCRRYKFGYYDEDDIKQECFIICVEALEKFELGRRLPNYLSKCLHHRLLNLQRRKWKRFEPPCDLCAAGNKHANGEYCKLYKSWVKRNALKTSLMEPYELTSSSDKKTWVDVDPIELDD